MSVVSDSDITGIPSSGNTGVDTIGAFSGSAQADGASISGTTITFGPADASTPGMVSTGSQVFAGTKRFQDALHIGTAPSATFPFSVDATAVSSGGSYFGGYIVARRAVTATDASSVYGSIWQNVVTVSAGQSQNALIAGALGESKIDGAGDAVFAIGVRGVVTHTGTGTVTDAAAFRCGTIANTGGGTITNTYGLYINNNTVGATANYPIYSAGTAKSYFVGGMDLASAKFTVDSNGNITKLNNVTQSWPGSQGSADTYLKNDGSGNLSWAAVSGTGDVVGPASAVNGNIATMDGTTGKLIRSESKYTVNPTTGGVTQTFASTPTYLNQMDISTATGWSAVRYVTGTVAATGNDLYVDDHDFSYALATNKKFVGRYYHPTFSSTTNERVLGDFVSLSAAASNAGWGGWQISAYGVFGGNIRIYNSSTTGAAGGVIGTAQGNQAIGFRGVGVANIGSSGKAGGISGAASTTGSAAIVYGGYFKLDANYDTGTESEVWPGTSAALICDTGDASTSIPAFLAQNAGTTVFSVSGADVTTIGASGGTNTHAVNGHLSLTGQGYSSQDTETQAASAAHTIDWNDGNSTVWDLQAATGNVTLTLSNPVAGASYIIKIIQSSTARTVTWPATVKWPGGVAPTLTTTNDAVDMITLYYDGTNYLCSFGLDVK